MDSPDERRSLPALLRRLLKVLSLDWLSLVLDLAHYLRHLLCAHPSDPYEILDYEATVDLLDTTGTTAHFIKRLQVRFLQNYVIALEDYAWGDGDILADYRCAPGVVVDKYREGDRWNVLISLRESKSRGDVEEFHITRTERNTFTQAEEWLQVEIRHRTRRLRMTVLYPKKRRCQRAVLLQRKAHRATVLGSAQMRILPDGRQLVSWETHHVAAYEIYTLKWWW